MGFFARSSRRGARSGAGEFPRHEGSEESESLKRIEGGGIPLAAERRLRGLAAEGGLFASGLSVKEFALLDRLGPRPLAQVLGASAFQVGWQYLPPPQQSQALLDYLPARQQVVGFPVWRDTV